jgi:hypothetical protein
MFRQFLILNDFRISTQAASYFENVMNITTKDLRAFPCFWSHLNSLPRIHREVKCQNLEDDLEHPKTKCKIIQPPQNVILSSKPLIFLHYKILPISGTLFFHVTYFDIFPTLDHVLLMALLFNKIRVPWPVTWIEISVRGNGQDLRGRVGVEARPTVR